MFLKNWFGKRESVNPFHATHTKTPRPVSNVDLRVERLDDRLAPHAGLWTSFESGLGQFGVISPQLSTTSQVATSFELIAQPSAYSGGEAQFLLVVFDANNRPVKNYTGTIHFSSTDASASLPADYTFAASDHGRHRFTATLTTEGSQTITATDTTTVTVTGNAKIQVAPAQVATHLYVSVERAAFVGAETRVIVAALDASNHPVTTYTGTVSLTSSDSGAALPKDYTFSASDHGIHVLTITPSVAGSLTVTVTDTKTATIVGSATTTVNAAQVVTKLFSFVRPVAKVGSQVTLFVVALDANNRPVTNYTGTVHFTSTDATATLPADFTFTAGDHGWKSFKVTLGTTGQQTITATDTTTATFVASSTVTVIDTFHLPGFGKFFGGGIKVDGWDR